VNALLGAAVVPTAPLVLPAVSHAQTDGTREEVQRLRTLAREALTSLPPADVHVLLAPGARGIYDRAHATLGSLGVPEVELELPTHEEVMEHLSRLIQYPVFRGTPLDVGLAVLALQLLEERGPVPVVPVNVPRGADFEVLVSVGAAIGEAAVDAGATANVVAAGDLSPGLDATAPAYAIDGAREWDEAVVRVAEEGDLGSLGQFGPDEAERVRAGGWAPLAAIHGVCASGKLSFELLGYAPTRGVGHVVARCVGSDRPRSDRYDAAAT
jgi:hypothetical protein